MSASLAERIRAIAVTLTPATINEAANALLSIAVPVQRIERALDEIAADAMESANLEQQRPTRMGRPHLVLAVVTESVATVVRPRPNLVVVK